MILILLIVKPKIIDLIYCLKIRSFYRLIFDSISVGKKSKKYSDQISNTGLKLICNRSNNYILCNRWNHL